MTHIDGLKGKIRVVIEEVAPKHPFASLEGLQCGFAFYTTRHALHPVVVTGPLADTSITASTLFGSILSLARNCGARDSGASC
jgi:homoserine dehydrogenase